MIRNKRDTGSGMDDGSYARKMTENQTVGQQCGAPLGSILGQSDVLKGAQGLYAESESDKHAGGVWYGHAPSICRSMVRKITKMPLGGAQETISQCTPLPLRRNEAHSSWILGRYVLDQLTMFPRGRSGGFLIEIYWGRRPTKVIISGCFTSPIVSLDVYLALSSIATGVCAGRLHMLQNQ